MVDYVRLEDEEKKVEKKERKSKSNFPRLNWKLILILFIGFFLLSSIISSVTYSITPKIAVVPIKGTLSTEKSSGSLLDSGSSSSRELASILRNLKDDSSVKAVLLDINSGGGSPVASEEISQAVEELKKVKPVYALVNDVGASGAFWVAVSADQVYASPMSMLGSIGVTSVGFGLEDFIEEYNISYRKLTAGEYKDLGTPFREMKEEEKEIIQGLLNEIHGNFITHVAKQRNMTYEEVENYATGEIFLGTKALNAGFIDELGYYPEVLEVLRNQTSNQSIVVDFGPEPTLAEELGLQSIFGTDDILQNKVLLK